MKKISGALSICVLLCISTSVFAIATYIDSVPPIWRGAAGSTVQGWEFGTDDKTPAPDLLDNDFGDPELTIWPTEPYEATWGGYDGVWHLSGVITATIQNNPVTNDYKYVQIQFVWAAASSTNPSVPCVSLDAWLADDTAVAESGIELLNQVDTKLGYTGVSGAGEYWYHSTYLFKIIPNPAVEEITIGSNIWIDGLVIDTICIPEPATMAIFGLGTLCLFRRKR